MFRNSTVTRQVCDVVYVYGAQPGLQERMGHLDALYVDDTQPQVVVMCQYKQQQGVQDLPQHESWEHFR